MQFRQTRSHAIALFNTLPAMCTEKVAIHEDWRGFILQITPIPKVTASRTHAKFASWSSGSLESRSENIRRPSNRTSAKYEETRRKHLKDTRRKHLEENHRAKYKETCRGVVDYRIQGIPHSTVQKEDSDRKEIFQKKPTQQFENHPKRDSFMEDLNMTEEFNPFSEKSKELITSMGNTDYFELCEIFSNIQCPDCS